MPRRACGSGAGPSSISTRSIVPVNANCSGYGPTGEQVSMPTSMVSPLIEKMKGTVRSTRPLATVIPVDVDGGDATLAEASPVVGEPHPHHALAGRHRVAVAAMTDTSCPNQL